MDNSVNLVLEGELQPFLQDGSKGSMNEMHLHTIPWPKEVLESLGDIPAQLKVTLSYFVEPGPGEIGWKDKYRYASCGLRFDVINKNESVDDFKKRINKKCFLIKEYECYFTVAVNSVSRKKPQRNMRRQEQQKPWHRRSIRNLSLSFCPIRR